MRFNAATRTQSLAFLRQHAVDVLIIGGGITGAGIAVDAASRGLSVALVEKNDFAYGTSSRSTKLIHGGLRYLKQLEFGLVKEVGSERAIVHSLAPHLVIPEKMLLPLYEGKQMGYWLTSIGLKVYDWLAGVRTADQRRMLSRIETLKAEPLLDSHGVKGGAIYAEYRTDDARLTIEAIKTAASFGALCVNYARVEDFVYEDTQVAGARVKDEQTGDVFQVRAAAVINAAGPWVDDLRTLDGSRQGKRLHLTKGVHLVVRRERFAVRQAIYFEVGDGRMIFAIPRGEYTYLGTTDTNFTGSQDEVVMTDEDADYLLAAANGVFPDIHLVRQDILSWWAGLRPLIHEEGKSAGELSRKDEIFESATGLLSIAGGKLTGYRKMAQRITDLVIEKYFLDRRLNECRTTTIPLVRVPFKNYDEVRQYEDTLVGQYTDRASAAVIKRLIALYGSAAGEILGSAGTGKVESRALLLAELNYATEFEMVIEPEDFLVRRSGLAYFGAETIDEAWLDWLVGTDLTKLNNRLARIRSLLGELRKFSQG